MVASTQETLLWFEERPAHLTFLLEQRGPIATGRKSIFTAANPSVKPITPPPKEHWTMEEDFTSESVSSYKNKNSGLGDPGSFLFPCTPLCIIVLRLWRLRSPVPRAWDALGRPGSHEASPCGSTPRSWGKRRGGGLADAEGRARAWGSAQPGFAFPLDDLRHGPPRLSPSEPAASRLAPLC